ncbi:uncharacterized protein K02A2.6-like [Anneissia japonica]|uniref:uncharacterized protein K02A2.6-like n=1 Tax=Anneissia japonica TaxID=1529436 RepID=UPI00142599EE|nr:uncharacterized protein K02A2.6-like [Anneissia japonica]
MGVVKIKSLARSFVWWPGIDHELEEVTKRCTGCQANRNMPIAAPVHPWEWPQGPWKRVHADFAGPFEGKMFFLLVDTHSKWPEVIEMSATSSEQTFEILRNVFARNGLPEQLVTDNGPQFITHTYKWFMEANGIRHTTSAQYHPRPNGLVERFVQTFKQAMRASRAQHSSLRKRLSTFLLNYRSTPQTTTQETAAKLFLGREH